jgi:hypothetical protein
MVVVAAALTVVMVAGE